MKQDSFVHWRDSARNPQFLGLDARVVIVLLYIMMFPSWGKTISGLIVVLLFAVLGYFKIPLTVAWRMVLGFIAGREKLRD